MKLSVLICTYNRPHLLARALEALLTRATVKPDEVIVVNGGGPDTDQVIAPHLGPGAPLRMVKTRNVSLAVSQNLGLTHCTGDYIALTDDDAMVAPDWVGALRQVLAEHPEAGAVGGPVISLYPEKLIARVAHYTTFPEPAAGAYVRTIAGVNVCYRRAAMAAVGRLDERLMAGEEVDYNWRLLKHGWRIWWDPRIQVFHHDRTDLRAFAFQQFRYGQAYWQTRCLHPDLYNRYPRDLHHGKDWLKAANFVPGLIADILRPLPHGSPWRDRLAFPMLFGLAGASHRLGYLYQAWKAPSPQRQLASSSSTLGP